MKKILVATDLETKSEPAICRGCRLAQAAGAEIRVLHVAATATSEPQLSGIRQQMEEIVGCRSSAPEGRALQESLHLAAGDPASVILEYAAEWQPDLIVLGGHGEPRFRDAVFGTTADHVLRTAKQPVLVVVNDNPADYRNALLATEGEELACLLQVAASVTRDPRLTVVHAKDDRLSQLLVPLDDGGDDEAVLAAKLQSLLPSAGLAPATEIRAIVAPGDADGLIMTSCELVRPDLLVMGTHAPKGLRRMFEGSHAQDAILAGYTDMLIVPLRGHQALAAA